MLEFDEPEIEAVIQDVGLDEVTWEYYWDHRGRKPHSPEAWWRGKLEAFLTGDLGLAAWTAYLQCKHDETVFTVLMNRCREIEDKWHVRKGEKLESKKPRRYVSFWSGQETEGYKDWQTDLGRYTSYVALARKLSHANPIDGDRPFFREDLPNPHFLDASVFDMMLFKALEEVLDGSPHLSLKDTGTFYRLIRGWYQRYPNGEGHELEYARGEWPGGRVLTGPPPAAGTVDLDRVRVGAALGGGPWELRIFGNHILVAGITGAGKGSVVWSLVNGLTAAVKTGIVELWGIDPKRVELSAGRDVWARYADTPETIVDLMEAAASEMGERTAAMQEARIRKITPSRETSVRVIVIDELGYMATVAGNRDLRKRFDDALRALLVLGRAAGYCVVGCLQDPRKETVDSRDLWPTKVAMWLERPMVALVLGNDAYAAGAHCDKFGKGKEGSAFVAGEDQPGEYLQVRAYWVSDDDIATIAEELGPYVRGEVMEAADDEPEALTSPDDADS